MSRRRSRQNREHSERSGSQHPDGSSGQTDRRFNLAVLLPSLLLCVVAVWFSWSHAGRLPYGDEYQLVDVLTGDRSLSVDYLFEKHNEHRIPLSRLVSHVILKVFNADFRFAAIAVPVILAMAAIGLLEVIRRSRGHWIFADNSIALLLFHFGHAENLIWGFQIQFALNVALVIAFIATFPVQTGSPSAGSWFAIVVRSLILILLPGTGANGMLAAVCLWPAFVLRDVIQSPGRCRLATVPVAFLIACEIAWYYLSIRGEARSPAEFSHFFQGLLYFHTLYFGPAASSLGQTAGLMILVALLAAGGWLFCQVLFRRNTTQAMTFCILLIGLAYGLTISLFRTAESPEEVLQMRYALLLVPVPIALYVSGMKMAQGRHRAIPHLIMLFAFTVYLTNISKGWRYADRYHTGMVSREASLRNGTELRPFADIAYHHPFGLYQPDADFLYERLAAMQRTQTGQLLSSSQPSPSHRKVPENRMSMDPRTGHMVFDQPVYVYAVSGVWLGDNIKSDRNVALSIWTTSQPSVAREFVSSELSQEPQPFPFVVNDDVTRLTFGVRDPGVELMLGRLAIYERLPDSGEPATAELTHAY